MSEERFIGFDARVGGTWSPERRAQYLLREDTSPLSLDPAVWPSVFDEAAIERPAWTGAFQELWDDLAGLRRFTGPDAALTAFTVHGELADFLEAHAGYTATGGRLPLPPTIPEERDPSWRLIGFDVCDVWGLSGLANCGYEDGSLRPEWASRLDEHHLFASLDDAAAFVRVTDERVWEHAPFLVYGLWTTTT